MHGRNQGRGVAVVGAGIVGACVAYMLGKRGVEVTLIDRDEPGNGCSYGNSGAISPGSVAPLAMPGILATVPRMLRDPDSPLYLPWAYLPQAAPWLMRFVASARPTRVRASAAKLAALHSGAVEAHATLAHEVGVPELLLRHGHLHLYPDEAAVTKDAASWQMRRDCGHVVESLDRAAILALEPHVGSRYQAGRFLPDHATITNPLRYVQAIVAACGTQGGRVRRMEVSALRPGADEGWSVDAANGRFEFEQVVVAAGAWSRQLLDPLGIHLPLESQRGYHVQFDGAAGTINRTVVLADRKVFVTPMEQGLRVGGTVEIGGLRRPADMRRAELLRRIACETFPELKSVASSQWMGHRPCMPDSVPVVGPAPNHPGLWLAVGHGHLGLTDSVNTARRIADQMLGSVPTSACSSQGIAQSNPGASE